MGGANYSRAAQERLLLSEDQQAAEFGVPSRVPNPARGVMEISRTYPGPAAAADHVYYQAMLADKHSPGRSYLDLGYSQALGTETAKFAGQVEQGQRWNTQERALDELIGV